MAYKRLTTTGFSSSRTNTALRHHVEADLAQVRRCERREHAMQATRSPGVVVCAYCLTVGACLWCGVIPPQGACVVACQAHADVASMQAAVTGTPRTSRKEGMGYDSGYNDTHLH